MTADNLNIDPAAFKRWMREAMGVYSELDTAQSEYMTRCKNIRSRLPQIYESAKNEGLHVKSFKLQVKEQLLLKDRGRLDARIDALYPDDDEDAAIFEKMRKIAREGDLFDAAIKAHDGRSSDGEAATDADFDDPRPAFLKKDRAADRTTENVTRLKAGIKGMPGADATEA